MPAASRRSSLSVCWWAKSWNSRTAISVEMTPARRIPPRKRSGSRTRSDENTPPPRSLAPGRVLRSVARGRDLVADAPHGDDRRRVAELAPELAHVDVDGARVARERVAPDALEELVAGEHEAAMVEQLPEEVELLRRELHLVVADAHLAPPGVDVQVAVLDDGALPLAPIGRRAAQDRPDARHELARVERLREVVVRADLEADDLVDVLVACGQHEDRHVGALANPLADLDAVDVREHQVEDDQRGRLRRHLRERLAAGRRRLDGVAGVLQVERDEGRDRALVLDDQDGRDGGRHA